MGAGRKTETYTLAHDSQYLPGTMSARLLKGDLCGVILGCKFSTIKECHAKKLFGLPAPHMAYIKNIDSGLTLFLFNYSDRTLHGIFEAASEGKMNIDPKAWSLNGTDPSPYPAQVRMRVRVRCEPLSEEKFRPAIAENYKDEKMFSFELDRTQTNKLLRLFTPSPSVRPPSARAAPPSTSKDVAPPPPPPKRKAIPASALVEIGDPGATRVDKWSSLFKSSDSSGDNNKGKDSKEGAHRASEVVNLGKAPASNVEPQASSQSGGASSSHQTYSQQLLHPTQKGTSGAANSITGQSKKVNSGEDTYSEIDWDAQSSFKAHLEGLNRILEDPKDKNGFQRFEGNTGFASSSSSMVPHNWEDSWEIGEGNNDKSPCGSSSYVSAATGDALEDIGDDDKEKKDDFSLEMGSTAYLDILGEVIAEVRVLKETQMKQAEEIAYLKKLLIRSRVEVLELQGRYGSS